MVVSEPLVLLLLSFDIGNYRAIDKKGSVLYYLAKDNEPPLRLFKKALKKKRGGLFFLKRADKWLIITTVKYF